MRVVNLRKIIGAVVSTSLLFVLSACEDAKRYDQALVVLIDVSGTYADQRKEVVRIVKSEVLPNMEPGDTLLILRIDGESYEKENVEVLVTLDPRPSRANAEKLGIAQRLDELAERDVASQHTDILGAMMLGGEYLRELEVGSRVMLIFSDMEEDLPPGSQRELRSDELAATHLVAMNVKHLHADTLDPAAFRSRLADWESRMLASGALDWRTLMDPTKLGDYLASVRTGT